VYVVVVGVDLCEYDLVMVDVVDVDVVVVVGDGFIVLFLFEFVGVVCLMCG